MNIEKLSREQYNSHHQDFGQCEELWTPIALDKAQAFVLSTQRTFESTRPNEDVSFLDWPHVKEALDAGRVVSLLPLLIRQVTDEKKCPLCGSSIPAGTEALSRRNNKTTICSSCALTEAMDEHEGQRG